MLQAGIVYYITGLAPEAKRFFAFWFIIFLMHQVPVPTLRVCIALRLDEFPSPSGRSVSAQSPTLMIHLQQRTAVLQTLQD